MTPSTWAIATRLHPDIAQWAHVSPSLLTYYHLHHSLLWHIHHITTQLHHQLMWIISLSSFHWLTSLIYISEQRFALSSPLFCHFFIYFIYIYSPPPFLSFLSCHTSQQFLPKSKKPLEHSNMFLILPLVIQHVNGSPMVRKSLYLMNKVPSLPRAWTIVRSTTYPCWTGSLPLKPAKTTSTSYRDNKLDTVSD